MKRKLHQKDFQTTKKTWKFKAENVRDYGFATSRRLHLGYDGCKNG